MGTLLLLFLAVTTALFSPTANNFPEEKKVLQKQVQLYQFLAPIYSAQTVSTQYITEVADMLATQTPELSPLVVNKVIMSLKCAGEFNVEHNNILTIIDYSLPSNQKRLWVFDLVQKKLLFHTYVSHGIKSGQLHTRYFSNKYNSKASSIGVYQTEQAYYGRDGLSLRLDGLDRAFNDNAANRAVVIHSGWYVEEEFIKKYGRPGRSWGCPALPLKISNDIINTIKNKSLLVIYYPNDKWFNQSRFLNCDRDRPQITYKGLMEIPDVAPDDGRDEILFVGGYKLKHAESNPVAVIAAERYKAVFHKPVPLTRMLRRQINHEEYVALSAQELKTLVVQKLALNTINFVIPVLKVVRGGYYETQMQVVNLGKIKEIKINGDPQMQQHKPGFTVYLEGKTALSLNPSNEFIRWVGL